MENLDAIDSQIKFATWAMVIWLLPIQKVCKHLQLIVFINNTEFEPLIIINLVFKAFAILFGDNGKLWGKGEEVL